MRSWILTLLLLLPAGATAATVRPPEKPEVSGLVEGIDLTSPEALGWTDEQAETAKRYSRQGWALWFLAAFIGMAAPALVAFSGFAGAMERWIRARLSSALAVDSVMIVAVVTCLAALNFPVEILAYVRERAYGFANLGPLDWMLDEIKGLVVVWVLALIALLPFWRAIRRWPRHWWILGSGIGVAMSILIIAVAPVFIAPLFNTFTPLSDEAVENRILALASREGIAVDRVYEVDASRQSRHDNAYVVGLFGTKRIVLYDTLLAAYTPDEIEFVMGHEMGHYVLNHIWKGVAFSSLAIIVGLFLIHRGMERTIRRRKDTLGYDSAGSIAALPLLLLFLSLYMFVLQPVSSGLSRHFEHQADVFALDIVGHAPEGRDVAVSAFQKMAARNLSNPNPPALIETWLYSHPAIGKRIRFCATQPNHPTQTK